MPMITKPGRVLTYHEGLPPRKSYLHYQSASFHQTWHDGDLPCRVPIHKVTWRFDQAVMQDHVTN